MTYIHELPDWPSLLWNADTLASVLADVRHRQGLLSGRMTALGFDLRAEAALTALTSDVVKSSAIEGEVLDAKDVRSSIARRLGIEHAAMPKPSRAVEGVVEMMVDAKRDGKMSFTDAAIHDMDPTTKEKPFTFWINNDYDKGGAVDTDDNNPCTTDSCDPATGCVFANNADAVS